MLLHVRVLASLHGSLCADSVAAAVAMRSAAQFLVPGDVVQHVGAAVIPKGTC
jgi:hypothetical protein